MEKHKYKVDCECTECARKLAEWKENLIPDLVDPIRPVIELDKKSALQLVIEYFHRCVNAVENAESIDKKIALLDYEVRRAFEAIFPVAKLCSGFPHSFADNQLV